MLPLSEAAQFNSGLWSDESILQYNTIQYNTIQYTDTNSIVRNNSIPSIQIIVYCKHFSVKVNRVERVKRRSHCGGRRGKERRGKQMWRKSNEKSKNEFS
jgi:hypothetical protein